MAGAATSLEVREVEVFYGTLRVLNQVSLSVRGGEFIVSALFSWNRALA